MLLGGIVAYSNNIKNELLTYKSSIYDLYTSNNYNVEKIMNLLKM